MDKESIYLLQLIDCNCNDCMHMVRDNRRLVLHHESYKGTGLMDNLQYGLCISKHQLISFIPNTLQLDTRLCFKHRRNNIFK
jgi:hypothetical protein